MKLSNIVDPIARGKRRRAKAIEKTIRKGIKEGTKTIREKIGKGKEKIFLSSSYINHFEYKFDFTQKEIEFIGTAVERHFIEKLPYAVVRKINVHGFGPGWYTVIIIEE